MAEGGGNHAVEPLQPPRNPDRVFVRPPPSNSGDARMEFESETLDFGGRRLGNGRGSSR